MFTGLIIANIISACIGALIVNSGLKNLHFYNKMKNLATSKVKSLAAGEVEIKGKASQKEPLFSPLKNTKCVSYNLKAYKWEKRGKSSSWKLLYEESVSKPFYLSDETGSILINPEGAKIRNDTFYSVQQNQLLPHIAEKINEPGNKNFFKTLLIIGTAFGGRFKFDEICVPEGEELYVMGYTVDNPNIINNPNVQRLMIAKKDKKDFIITDEKENNLQKWYLITSLILCTIGLFIIFFGIIQVFNILDWAKFMEAFV